MSLRLFAALAIPDDIADRLLPLMKGVPGAKWRPRENLHLTLRFFGELTEPVAEDLDAALEEATRGHAPFDVRLKGAGSFGGADPHALWIGAAESEALRQLAAACETRGAAGEAEAGADHKFTPHVTVAYLSGAPLDRVQAFEARLGLFEAPPFRVGALWALFERHAEIRSEPLSGSKRNIHC